MEVSMFDNNNKTRHSMALAALLALSGLSGAAWADAYEEAAKKWIADEFNPSTLTPEQQLEELKWFIKAAEPFRGMNINVASETLTTHEYESKVLAKAFSEITGIKLKHDLMQEGDVVEKLQTQMQSGKNIYDGWVNDSDLIGTHFRYGKAVSITDMMANEGKDFTSPTLDLDDFIGLSFTTGPDGKVYQLPDQQFANLYWFRADWFERPELKAKFKEIYGYELGVPVNWSAYEDIAEFFSVHVKEIDGKRVYGHMDYGKKDPSLGWRFTDAWFSMAGGGVRHAEIRRLDATVRAAGSAGHDLLRIRPGAGAGRHRSADLLVHRFYRRYDQAGPAGGQRRWHAEMAYGTVAQGPVLGGGHEARLSGHRLLDFPQLHAGEAAPGRLALCAVRHLQDCVVEEDPGRPDADSRVGHQLAGDDGRSAQAGWSGGVLPQSGTCAMDANRHQRA
jgi:hypothetical protein